VRHLRRRILEKICVLYVEAIAPRIALALEAAAGGFLPFRFGWQPDRAAHDL
jgi:hypothetical protein